MSRAPLLALVLLLAPLAGCLEPPTRNGDEEEGDEPIQRGDYEPPAVRIDGMTADERHEDKVERCDQDGVQVPPAAWCATRVVTVVGRIGLDALPVDLRSVNGAISLSHSVGDAWGMVATLKTRGVTEEQARRALDDAWTWSHEDADGAHRLHAAPRPSVPLAEGSLASVHYLVTLPAWLHLPEVHAASTNGAIALGHYKIDKLVARTTNGAVTASARIGDADLETTNGAIQANLVAARSGAWNVRTTNGAITLIASEHATRGFDLDARTTNGRIHIGLSQGEIVEEERNHKRFVTDGFDRRDIQIVGKIQTTNGAITVEG